MFVLQGSEELPILYIHRQSAYLLGRDRKVADIPLDHPSCSKQHSVLQYRLVPITRQDGTTANRVQLYAMDLNSANGTFVNNKKIESQKYIQLLEKVRPYYNDSDQNNQLFSSGCFEVWFLITGIRPAP